MARGPKKPKSKEPASPPAGSVLPMQLQVGDRFTDETGEWEIASQPATSVGGKTVRVRVRKVGKPAVKEERVWSAYERVAMRRSGA